MLHISYVLCFVLVFPTVLRGIQGSYVKEGANIRDMVTTADTYVHAHYSFVITGTDARVQVTKFNHIDYTENLMEFTCLMVTISIKSNHHIAEQTNRAFGP